MESQAFRIRDKVGLSNNELDALLSAVAEAAEPFNLAPLEISIAPGSLRITLDGAPEDLALEEIAGASKAISTRLDQESAIAFLEQRYELEVSSPGLERPLLNVDQLRRATGSLVEIEVSESGRSKRLRGHLREVSGDLLVIDLEPASDPARKKGQRPKLGQRTEFSLESIVSAKTVFEWPGRSGGAGEDGLALFDADEDDLLQREDLEEDEDNGTQ
jgi:ribosome maturation factor RimP